MKTISTLCKKNLRLWIREFLFFDVDSCPHLQKSKQHILLDISVPEEKEESLPLRIVFMLSNNTVLHPRRRDFPAASL
jgi:hypothetical protein